MSGQYPEIRKKRINLRNTYKKSTRRNNKKKVVTRYRMQHGGTFSEKALAVLKSNNLELRAFMSELYQQKGTKTVDGIVFKVIKKADRYFDIFDLYLLAKTNGLFSTYQEIIKVDFGSGSLS
jgi:hypothetical protein